MFDSKKVIIVSGEKELVYAELLSSLISLKDDDGKKQIVFGIQDGSVEAVVWNEKIYNDNKIQLGSNTKIIFIGKNKSSDSIIPNINFSELEKFGINIGWIGNKAVIYVQEKILMNNSKLYDEFFEIYKKTLENFDDSISNLENLKKAKHTDSIDKAIDKGVKSVGYFVGGIFNKNKKNQMNAKGTDFFNFGAKIEASNLIPDQMYRYSILNFYMNDLSKFMEIE